MKNHSGIIQENARCCFSPLPSVNLRATVERESSKKGDENEDKETMLIVH